MVAGKERHQGMVEEDKLVAEHTRAEEDILVEEDIQAEEDILAEEHIRAEGGILVEGTLVEDKEQTRVEERRVRHRGDEAPVSTFGWCSRGGPSDGTQWHACRANDLLPPHLLLGCGVGRRWSRSLGRTSTSGWRHRGGPSCAR